MHSQSAVAIPSVDETYLSEGDMTTGERLVLARRRADFRSVQAASEMLSFTRQALAMWERDRTEPGAQALRELSEVYGVSADWLLGLKNPPPPIDPAIRAAGA